MAIPGGFAWERLHSERENICAVLLGEPGVAADVWEEPAETLLAPEAADANTHAVEWKRRELLRARLHQIDDALDRVISGFHGHCSDCGRPIDSSRLAVDLAVSRCLNCQSSG
jgi:RNA polymerase-binding transcription factor DksA